MGNVFSCFISVVFCVGFQYYILKGNVFKILMGSNQRSFINSFTMD